MEPERDDPASHWRVDKRIPLPMILLMVGQIAGGVAAFTKVQADVSFIREHVTDLRERVSLLNNRTQEVEGIKVELRFLNENFKRMRGQVDRLVEDRFSNRKRDDK